MIRLIAGGLLLVAAALAAYRVSWIPYRLNIEKRYLEAATLSVRQGSTLEQRDLATRLIARADRCVSFNRADYECMIIKGLNEQALGMPERAVRTFETAASLHARPEIFANIAVVKFQQGAPTEGMDYLMRACNFNIAFSAVVDQATQDRVHELVKERRARLSEHRE